MYSYINLYGWHHRNKSDVVFNFMYILYVQGVKLACTSYVYSCIGSQSLLKANNTQLQGK